MVKKYDSRVQFHFNFGRNGEAFSKVLLWLREYEKVHSLHPRQGRGLNLLIILIDGS
jgi:hypothetical protein